MGGVWGWVQDSVEGLPWLHALYEEGLGVTQGRFWVRTLEVRACSPVAGCGLMCYRQMQEE